MDLQSVHNFLRWAEIEKDGWIEVNYLLYNDGKYTNGKTEFWKKVPDSFSCPDNCLVTVGVNPRVEQKRAHDPDIRVYKNLYYDLEPVHAPGTIVSEAERDACYEFANTVMNGFTVGDLWRKIVQSESGNGMHLMIAIPAYDNPVEFGNKLQTFYKTVLLSYTKSIKNAVKFRIDSTFSPSRQIKLPGTSKPLPGARTSSFPNQKREESQEFLDYILSFPEKPRKQVAVQFDGTQLTLEEIEKQYGLV